MELEAEKRDPAFESTLPGESARPGAGGSIEQAGEERSARIESLRAIAALAVLLGHVVAVSLVSAKQFGGNPADADVLERLLYGGGYGVFFFFALTGYLLFWPFAKRDFGDGKSLDLGRYGRNRAVRILPLYAVAVLIVLALHDGGATLGTWVRYATLTINFDASSAVLISGLGPLWSVIVEIHFYILLPLLAWAIARLAGGSRRNAAIALLSLAAISLAVRLITLVFAEGAPDPIWRLNLPANFLFFVPGMVLALLRLQWQQHGLPGWLRGPLRRSDVWVVASLPLWALPVFKAAGWAPVIGISAFLMVGACVLPLEQGRLLRALEWRPLALLGVASYSLYVWHLPVIEVFVDAGWETNPWTVLALGAVPGAIAVAFASYRWIEAPFLRLREQWSSYAAAKHSAEPTAGAVAEHAKP